MRMCSSRAKVQAGRFGVLNAALLFTFIWSATAQRSGYRGCLERALTCGPAQGASFGSLQYTLSHAWHMRRERVITSRVQCKQRSAYACNAHD